MQRNLAIVTLVLMLVITAACTAADPSGTIEPRLTVAAAGASPAVEKAVPDTSATPQQAGRALPPDSPEQSAGPTLGPTATPAPWDGYPAPTETPPTAVPPPVQPVRLPPEVQVIALLGTDNYAPSVGRTDTILLLFLNTHNGSASLVSIPRDLFVYIPGWTMQRINTAYATGGSDLFSLTLEYNLGLRPEHWALAHLDDFSRFVDDLGGIDIQVPVAVQDPWCAVPAGSVHLDGYTALCYVRSRLGSSDFERSTRQQDVLMALFQRFLSVDSLRRLPEWYAGYKDSLQTDLTLTDLLAFVPISLRLQDAGVHHFQIGWEEVQSWTVPDTGASVLLPRRDKILPLLQQAVDVLLQPVPTSPALEIRIAELTASPTPPATETSPPELTENGADLPINSTETAAPGPSGTLPPDGAETPSPTP